MSRQCLNRLGTLSGLLVALGAAACVPKVVAPGPSPVRTATPVSASYDRTWQAVISHFADRNISIRTIEKASGIIVAEPARVDLVNRTPMLDKNCKVRRDGSGRPLQSPPLYADCGSLNGYGYDPTSATYNIRVLGDSTQSTVQVNARYVSASFVGGVAQPGIDCASTGKFEDDLQALIRQRAEGR